MNPQPPRLISKRKGRTSPDDALEAMGLTAISAAIDIPVDSALVVIASILTGLAGQDAWIQSPWGPGRLPKLDLLTAKEDFRIQRWINYLSAPLEMMQQRLALNMGSYSQDAMELLVRGPHSSAITAKLANPEMREASLRKHMEILTKPLLPGTSGRLVDDLTKDSVARRMESVLHPNFLLKGLDGRNLKSLVADCHSRSSLVIQPRLELERNGSAPAKVLKILTDLLDGDTVMSSPASIERGRDSSMLAKAQTILALTKGEIDAIHALSSDNLNRFLWLKAGNLQERKPGNPNDGLSFCETYQQTIEEILELRREGQRLLMTFETNRMACKFASELRAYEIEIESTTGNSGPWARGLPQTLFWSLGFLRRSMPPELRPSEESLMTAAFTVARRLIRDNDNQFLAITQTKLLADRRKLAGKIVEDVASATFPMKFRDIARCNHVQTKEKISPVMDALIEVGVLIRDEDGFHALGSVDLADASEILEQKFLHP